MTKDYELIKDKTPKDIIYDCENIYLNPFIHYKVLGNVDNEIVDFKKMQNAYMLLLKIFFEHSTELKITLNFDNWEEAIKKNLIRTYRKAIWKLSCGEYISYSDSLPIAIAKLFICLEFDIKL